MTQNVANKRLSDYILDGAALTEPACNQMLSRLAPNYGPVYACATGAACYAKDPERSLRELMYATTTIPRVAAELFPELNEFVQYRFPEDSHASRTRLGSLIVCLNDTYGKRREEIAAVIQELGY
jgi:hypothetical protein